jgi:lipopolysaccharide transport system ATP-binding protein
VFLNGSLLGFSRREMERKLDEIVDFAEIGDFIDLEVKHYSSGMYTRLGFAVATAVDPDILITDEVLAVGDEAFQRKCMERIYRFRQLGKSIVFVSHALEIVRQLCDHAVWLDHGVARAVGAAGAVIDAYLEDVNLREAEARRKAAAAQPAGMQPAAEVAERSRRHGTREVEIVRIELLDADGCEQAVFHTHDMLTVRMHYVAHQPVAGPVFGVMLHHEAGLWLLGPNNRFGGLDIPMLAGAGYVDYTIVDLPLLGGRYQLSVNIYDDALLHAYDAHDRLYQLVIQSHRLPDRYGMLSIPARWAWCEGRA